MKFGPPILTKTFRCYLPVFYPYMNGMTFRNGFIKMVFLLLIILCALCNAQAQIKTLKGKIISNKEIDSFISRQMDSLKIPGLSFAILQNGKIAYYKATGIRNEKGEAVDSQTVFEAASMTKPLFAYAVHNLAQKGRIHLDTPLYRYHPYDDIDYDARYKLLTARMVLSHTTGFPNWRGCGGSVLSISFDPGTKYNYSGEGFEYLSLALKHALGKKVQDILQDEVMGPLAIRNAYLSKNAFVQEHLADGMKDNTEWGRNGVWQQPRVAYGLCTEAREYAKFVMRLMQESRTPNSIFSQMSMPQIQSDSNEWACLGLFRYQTPYGPKYGHGGNNNNRYNSNFEFYTEHDLAFVFFMNCHQEPAFTKRLNTFLENDI